MFKLHLNRLKYLLIYLPLAIVTILVEYFSEIDNSLRESLELKINGALPPIYQFITSSIVHFDQSQFIGDISGYAIIILYGYFLALAINREKLFSIIGVIISGIFIFILPIFNFLTKKQSITAGLSGVDAALLGLIIAFSLYYLACKSSKEYTLYRTTIIPIIYVLILIIVGIYLFYSEIPINIQIIGLLGLLILFFIITTWYYRSQFYNLIWQPIKLLSLKEITPLFVILIIFVISLYAFFPKEVRSASGTVDIATHMVGIILGFFISFYLLSYFNGKKFIKDTKSI